MSFSVGRDGVDAWWSNGVPRYMVDYSTTLTTQELAFQCGPSASSPFSSTTWKYIDNMVCECRVFQHVRSPAASIPGASRCMCGGPEVGQVGEVPCDVTRAATSRPSPCNQPVTNDTTHWTRPHRTRGRGQADSAQIHPLTLTTAVVALPVASSLPVSTQALLPGGARACSSCSLQSESSPPRQIASSPLTSYCIASDSTRA